MSKNTSFKKYTGGLSQSISILNNVNALPNAPPVVNKFYSENFGGSSSNTTQPTTSYNHHLNPSIIKKTTTTTTSNSDAFAQNYHYHNITYYQGHSKQRYQQYHHQPNAVNPYFDEEAFFLQQEPYPEYIAATSSSVTDEIIPSTSASTPNETKKKIQYIGSRIYRKSTTTTTTSGPPSPNKNKIQREANQYGKRAFHTNLNTFASPGSINLSRAFSQESRTPQSIIVEYDDEFERKLAIITGPESQDENNNKWLIVDIHGMNKVVNSNQLTYQFSNESNDKRFNIDDAKQMQIDSANMISNLTTEDCDKMWRSFLQRKNVKITIKEASEHLFQSTDATALYSAYRFLYKNPLYFKHTSNLNFECRSLREVEELKHMGSEEKENILLDKLFLLKITNRLLVTNEERSLFYKQLRNNIMKEIKAMRPDIEITRDNLELDEQKDAERLGVFRQYALGMYSNLESRKRIYEAFFKPLGADDHLQAFRVARDLKLFKTQNIHLLRSMEEDMCHMKEEDKFKQIVEEARNSIMSASDPDSKIRKDLRHLTVFTIDEYPKTTEVDDGVSIEVKNGEYYIYVHIADVTRYIDQGSSIDKEAQKRVSSVYLPDIKFSMIAADLSANILSLSDLKENFSLTFSSKINSDGSLSEWDVFPAILGKVKKVDYSMADNIIENTVQAEPEVQQAFEHMVKVANLRFAFRMGKGATPPTLTPRPKVYVSDSEKNIEVSTTFEELVSPSRRLVQEFMIAANEIGGFYAHQHDIAVPYRGTRTVTTDLPPLLSNEEMQKILSLRTNLPEKDVCELVVDSNKKFYPIAGVCINQSPKFHQGIGSANYVQVTSPIRRYSDLMVHYQLKAQMRGEKQPFTWDEIQEMIFAIEPTTRAINSLQKKSERFWLLKYFEQNLTKSSNLNKYKALVLETRKNSVTSLDPNELPYTSELYLMESAFKTSVKSAQNRAAGNLVFVRVSSVSPYNDEITFEEA
ncbi:predicted protein [Naegleria gruberi]|uniref:Predicted protein n=1 Tax=Naegleria gruberi TaxID=5762 RepID=D2UYW9_NAEGR|nr:uncharacterized protein NAEGRDRAFT_56583 [Naegleria gruberi]EFC50044.1 predicted protein [Naegleria gruberi]|eukprot:XP_002682788.1 predicted protein [Naegleria gruberi strain NEG-M]